MLRPVTATILGTAGLLALLAAFAQEGYPLDGTWRGTWGPDDNHVVIVMQWDGESINGTVNPGPNSTPFDSASLDPSTWTVRIESKTPEGEPIVIDGRLEDIGSYNRRITGTWTQGGTEYDFEITRQ